MKKEIILYLIISLLLFILFPLNMSFTSTNYGLYFGLSYLVYFFCWVFPGLLIIKQKKIVNKIKLLNVLLIINIGIIYIFFIFATYQANINQKELYEKIKKNEQLRLNKNS